MMSVTNSYYFADFRRFLRGDIAEWKREASGASPRLGSLPAADHKSPRVCPRGHAPEQALTVPAAAG